MNKNSGNRAVELPGAAQSELHRVNMTALHHQS
jgi:hypothetical protein